MVKGTSFGLVYIYRVVMPTTGDLIQTTMATAMRMPPNKRIDQNKYNS